MSLSTNSGPNIDFSNRVILKKETNLDKRLILEIIEILKDKNFINKIKRM